MEVSEAVQKEIKLEMPMPELASEERAMAMEVEEDKSFLAADNGEMPPQLGEGEQRPQGKQSIWRDLEQFWPIEDPAKMDEIRQLYGVSVPRNRKNNFIYMSCCSTKRYKCKYLLRWSKLDGLVQARGEHNHKKFILPRKVYKPNKCRECPFETSQIALMREHYGQVHTGRQALLHCDHCPGNFTSLTDFRRHVHRHEKAKQKEKKKKMEAMARERQLEEMGEGDEEDEADAMDEADADVYNAEYEADAMDDDDLDDLRRIFDAAIADELRKEREREEAGRMASASASSNVQWLQRAHNWHEMEGKEMPLDGN